MTAAFVETDAWLRTVPAVQRDQSGTTCVVAGLRRRPQEAGAGAPTCARGSRTRATAGASSSARAPAARRPSSRARTTSPTGPTSSLASRARRRRDRIVAARPSRGRRARRADRFCARRRAGGFVSDADAARRPAAAPPAVARLDGNLAVSRGLGDFAYKADGRLAPGDQKVSCAPEFYGAELRAGDLLILACDGVFDVMSNEGLCRAVAAALDGGADVGDVARACWARACGTCTPRTT